MFFGGAALVVFTIESRSRCNKERPAGDLAGDDVGLSVGEDVGDLLRRRACLEAGLVGAFLGVDVGAPTGDDAGEPTGAFVGLPVWLAVARRSSGR